MEFFATVPRFIFDMITAWGLLVAIVIAVFGLIYVMMSPKSFDAFMNMIGIGVEHDETYKYTP